MPAHDWTLAESDDFHDFHQGWVIGIRDALNTGLLPRDYLAMAEQVTARIVPDSLTVRA